MYMCVSNHDISCISRFSAYNVIQFPTSIACALKCQLVAYITDKNVTLQAYGSLLPDIVQKYESSTTYTCKNGRIVIQGNIESTNRRVHAAARVFIRRPLRPALTSAVATHPRRLYGGNVA